MMDLIWDFDGTLYDSYPKMIAALLRLTKCYGLSISEVEIWQDIIDRSIIEYLNDLAYKTDRDILSIRNEFALQQAQDPEDSPLIEGAARVLKELYELGVRHYIYTHKNHKTLAVLQDNGIEDLFVEVVTSDYGFKRKPDAEGIEYLLVKYNLDRDRSFYIGDRALDIKAAQAAGIKSILFNNEDPDTKPSYRVSSLDAIISIIIKELDNTQI